MTERLDRYTNSVLYFQALRCSPAPATKIVAVAHRCLHKIVWAKKEDARKLFGEVIKRGCVGCVRKLLGRQPIAREDLGLVLSWASLGSFDCKTQSWTPNLDIIKEFLQNRRIKRDCPNDALRLAARHNLPEFIRTFIQDERVGRYDLWFALGNAKGNKEAMAELLSCQKVKGEIPGSALVAASKAGLSKFVKMYLDGGLVETSYLEGAVSEADPTNKKIVRLFIQNPIVQQRIPNAVLVLAAKGGFLESVKGFLKSKLIAQSLADALFGAFCYRRYDVVDELLRRQRMKRICPDLVLVIAAKRGNLEIVNEVLKIKSLGKNALAVILNMYIGRGHPEIIKKLPTKKLRPSDALRAAAHVGNLKVVRGLLRKDAYIKEKKPYLVYGGYEFITVNSLREAFMRAYFHGYHKIVDEILNSEQLREAHGNKDRLEAGEVVREFVHHRLQDRRMTSERVNRAFTFYAGQDDLQIVLHEFIKDERLTPENRKKRIKLVTQSAINNVS